MLEISYIEVFEVAEDGAPTAWFHSRSDAELFVLAKEQARLDREDAGHCVKPCNEYKPIPREELEAKMREAAKETVFTPPEVGPKQIAPGVIKVGDIYYLGNLSAEDTFTPPPDSSVMVDLTEWWKANRKPASLGESSKEIWMADEPMPAGLDAPAIERNADGLITKIDPCEPDVVIGGEG